MTMKNQVIIIFLILYSITSCKTYSVKCSPNVKKTLYKDANNIWPVYGKTFDASMKELLKILGKTLVEDISLKTTIEPFREKLKNEYSIVQDFMKAKYSIVKGDPCIQKNWDNFNASIDDLSEKTFELEKLKLKLKKVSDDTKAISDKEEDYKEIISTFNGDYKYFTNN